MIKAVIFDLNGVFITGEPLSIRVRERWGVPTANFLEVLNPALLKARKPGNEDIFTLLKPGLEKLGIKATKEEFLDFWFSGEHVVPELINYTRSLREGGIKVFVLSNNFRERTQYYRKKFPEIFENLDGAFFSWETGHVKPKKEAFLDPLEKNSLKPGECIYYDDKLLNVDLAEGLGFQAYEYRGLGPTRKTIEGLTKNSDKERV